MPGDGQSGDRMYMRFRLQYLSPTTGHWSEGGTGDQLRLHPGRRLERRAAGRQQLPARQGTGKPRLTLRGVVDFQWRRGKTVLQTAERTTTGGHRSLAGADPASYTAARCVIR